ncbi:MAG: hypothetical protein U9O66_02230 [Patescibacteria group bacterium]|nr:hypothetical protein [Patescibacteria group bacterium]
MIVEQLKNYRLIKILIISLPNWLDSTYYIKEYLSFAKNKNIKERDKAIETFLLEKQKKKERRDISFFTT